MKKNFSKDPIRPVIISLLMLLVIGVMSSAQMKNTDVTSSDTKIVTVHGQDITYGDIKVTSAESAAYAAYGGKKQTKEAFINQTELQNLKGKINDIVIPYLRKFFHIKITDKDIQDHRSEIEKELNFDQSFVDLQKKSGELLRALEDVYENGMDKDIVYDKYLKSTYSIETWHRMLKKYYPDQKSYQTLKDQYKKSFLITQEQKDVILDEQVVKILQMRELTSAILEVLSTKDPIAKSDIDKLQKDPSDNELKMRVRKRYQEWWENEYKKLVKVYDPKYNSVFELLKNSTVFYPTFENNRSSKVENDSYPKSSQSAQNGAPPIRTTVFNQKTIEELIANIDNPQNIMLLKIGYFAGHKKHPFVTGDGFTWLTDALDKTKVGTLRWFLIESVRGFGAFHAQDVLNDYGRDAYQAIFDNADLAKATKEKYVVLQSIQDMVFCIGTTLDTHLFLHEPKLDALLLKAWQLKQQLKTAASMNSHLQSLDWGRAIERVHAQDKFTAIVGDALKDTTHAPDFQMLKLAVVVLEDQEPQRAIDLLKTAQKKMEPGDLNQQKWLYETWAQLITGNDPSDQLAPKITDKTQLAALVEMRKDQISYTGHGYADLLKLYWQLNQNDKAAELMKVILQPGVRAEEKIDVAKVLLTPPRDLKFDKDAAKQMQTHGVGLLQTYLSSTDKRNPDEEIRARYELGRYFVKQDQITQALQALDIGETKPASRNSETAFYYQQILQMKAALEKKLSDIPGAR